MLLTELQSVLQDVYDVHPPGNIYDFLVTDGRIFDGLCDANFGSWMKETVFVSQDSEFLNMALYLDEVLLERLAGARPNDCLSANMLADFCTVLKGISHFNFLAWNAGFDKSVSLVELELQAEIDKYIVMRLLCHEHDEPELAARLHTRLFDDCRFHTELTDEQLERYRDASQLAGQYCHDLEQRFSDARVSNRMVTELRRFFRMPMAEKTSKIRASRLN